MWNHSFSPNRKALYRPGKTWTGYWNEKVDFIVSGDPHLLDLKTYKNIPILTPREFVERMLKS